MIVPGGANQTFTITPDSGYSVSQVLVDGVSQGAISTYTFTNVAASHTISATFVLGDAGGTQISTLDMGDSEWFDARLGASGPWGTFSIYANGALIGTKAADGTSIWNCPQTSVPSGARIDIVADVGFTDPMEVYDYYTPHTFTTYLPAGATRLEAATWGGFPLLTSNDGTDGYNWGYPENDYTFVYLAPATITNIVYSTSGVDTTPPVGSVSVNAGAAYANTSAATLALSANDAGGSGVSQMRFSNDNSTWSPWETYTTSKSWTLSAGDGSKNVYVQYRDVVGNESTSYSDGITLDTLAPSGTLSVNNDATYATSTAATANSAVTDSGSGMYQMAVDPGTGAYGSWIAYVASSPITLPPPDGTKTVRVQYKDNAGNIATLSDSIVLDANSPVGTMMVNSNDTYTRSTAATVNSTMADVGSSVAQMSIDPGTGTYGSWVAYNGASAITLPTGDGIKTVRTQYRDVNGNVSTLSDSIILDTTAPTTTSSATSGATYTGIQVFTLTPTDAGGSGVALTSWQLDSTSGTWASGTSVSVPAPASGTVSHTLYWYSTDNAGNSEAQASATFSVTAPAPGSSQSFSYTGADQTYSVPSGVTALTVDVYGAEGGEFDGAFGGPGGLVQAVIPVTPGQVLTVKVGGAGGDGTPGWPNGGGAGHGGGGGGSSSILLGTTVLAEAGAGGGGDHIDTGPSGGAGGEMGWLPGGNQFGGVGEGAGGGGGWNGGAGSLVHEGGGGGGTSYVAVGSGSLSAGVQTGNGLVVVTPVLPGTQTFNASGENQFFTVPAGITAVTVNLHGAQGGNGGGPGGLVHASIPVMPGQVLTVRVGDSAGWPNGGTGTNWGGAGGGSTSILLGSSVLAEAGGGGGFADGTDPAGAGGASPATDPGGNQNGADGLYGGGGGGGWNGGYLPGDDTSGNGGTSRIAVGTGLLTPGAREGDGLATISW